MDGTRTAAAATLAAMIGFALLPGLDLALARLFYDPAARLFPAAADPRLAELRSAAMAVTAILAGLAAAALLLRMTVRAARRLVCGRAAGFLLVSLAVGPGLLANAVLKEHWERPRPDAVLAGGAGFAPWWQPGGGCDGNCSFVSGEAAAAFWLTGLAALAPPRWRRAALGLALAYGAAVGGLRIAFGRHFLSDVVFAGLIAVWANLLCHRLCFGRRAPLPLAWHWLAGLAGRLARQRPLLALPPRWHRLAARPPDGL